MVIEFLASRDSRIFARFAFKNSKNSLPDPAEFFQINSFFLDFHAFFFEQGDFFRQAAGITTQSAVGINDSVARHDYRMRVVVEDLADGSKSFGPAGEPGDCFVGRDAASGNPFDYSENFFAD